MRSTLRRAVLLLALLASLLPLSGCWVYSVYPLAETESDLILDRLLAGNWRQPREGCAIALTRFEGEKTYRVVYTAAVKRPARDGYPKFEPDCLISDGQSASYEGAVVELSGVRFLDVYPSDKAVSEHTLLIHSLYRLKVDLNSLTLTPMKFDAIRSLVAEDKLRGLQRTSDEAVVLTASTKELREFIRQNVTNDHVWNVEHKMVFERWVEAQ